MARYKHFCAESAVKLQPYYAFVASVKQLMECADRWAVRKTGVEEWLGESSRGSV